MSLLRKPARPVAPESARLLREARRARRLGYRNVAEKLAEQSFAVKGTEPTIWRSEDREAVANIREQAAEEEVAAAQRAAQQQKSGRKAFANQILKGSKENPDETYEIAKQEAPKYGVSPSALASFFERNKLPVKQNLDKYDTYEKRRNRSSSGVEGASGIEGAYGLTRK
jgi:hypothetical protein